MLLFEECFTKEILPPSAPTKNPATLFNTNHTSGNNILTAMLIDLSLVLNQLHHRLQCMSECCDIIGGVAAEPAPSAGFRWWARHAHTWPTGRTAFPLASSLIRAETYKVGLGRQSTTVNKKNIYNRLKLYRLGFYAGMQRSIHTHTYIIHTHFEQIQGIYQLTWIFTRSRYILSLCPQQRPFSLLCHPSQSLSVQTGMLKTLQPVGVHLRNHVFSMYPQSSTSLRVVGWSRRWSNTSSNRLAGSMGSPQKFLDEELCPSIPLDTRGQSYLLCLKQHRYNRYTACHSHGNMQHYRLAVEKYLCIFWRLQSIVKFDRNDITLCLPKLMYAIPIKKASC